MARQTKAQKLDRADAITRLREWVKPGDTLNCILRHRSTSGMRRIIQVLKMENDQPAWLGFNIARALDMRYDREREGIVVDGTGMDMGFHVVYELAYALYPDGFDCIGDRCPSNDHHNYPNGTAPTHHTSGGYALKHRWL